MLTRKAARGASLTLAASMVGRVAALAAQIITGLLLVEDDFGVYASVIGLLAIAGLFRGGSPQSYLVTLAPARRRFRTGTVFWVSTSLYLVGIVPLLFLAPAIADHLGTPSLVPLTWVVTGTTLLVPLRSVFKARLNTEFRFGAGALAQLVNDLIVYSLTIVLAVVLRSAMALALPVLLGGIVEIALLAWMARPHRCDFIPRRRLIGPVLYQLRWLIAVSAMMSLWTNGDYFIAEFLVPTAVLGGYYFGYQLAVQPGRLFNVSIMNVLVPVVRRVAHDPERLRSALRRMLGVGGFAITSLNVALLALIEPIERLVWAGRWSDTVLAVQMLVVGLSFASIFNVATSPFMAQRRYRDALLCNALRAVGVVGGAAIGSVVGGSIESIAAWVAGSMLVSSSLGIAWVLRDYGIRVLPMLAHMYRCCLVPVAAAVVAAVVGSVVLDAVGEGRLPALVAFATAGGTYAVIAPLSLLLLPAATRGQLIDLLPGRLRDRLPEGWRSGSTIVRSPEDPSGGEASDDR